MYCVILLVGATEEGQVVLVDVLCDVEAVGLDQLLVICQLILGNRAEKKIKWSQQERFFWAIKSSTEIRGRLSIQCTRSCLNLHKPSRQALWGLYVRYAKLQHWELLTESVIYVSQSTSLCIQEDRNRIISTRLLYEVKVSREIKKSLPGFSYCFTLSMKKVTTVTKKYNVQKLTVLKWWDMTISTKLLVHPDSCTQRRDTFRQDSEFTKEPYGYGCTSMLVSTYSFCIDWFVYWFYIHDRSKYTQRSCLSFRNYEWCGVLVTYSSS